MPKMKSRYSLRADKTVRDNKLHKPVCVVRIDYRGFRIARALNLLAAVESGEVEVKAKGERT